jgi:serine protease Do
VGVSFSSPIDLVLRIAQRIRTDGGVVHGRVGMAVQPVTPDLARAFGLDGPIGALVIRVDPSAAAGRAGVRSGDIVLMIDDAAPASYADIQERVSMARPGQSLNLSLWRQRAMQRLTVVADGESASPRAQQAEPSARSLIRLGLSMMEVDNAAPSRAKPGLHVIGVGGAAMQAGVMVGDVVLGVNDAQVLSFAEFDKALKVAGFNQPVALLVLRRGAMNYIAVAAPAQPG